MDIDPQTIALGLVGLSELLSLLPEKLVRSNGLLHTFVVLIKTCNKSFQATKKGWLMILKNKRV